jgi:choline dehydrogenase
LRNDHAADFIVVGAGSAGSVLANRLSANPGIEVLLLEAGGWDHSPFLRVPAGEERVIGDERFNWGYRTNPDPTRFEREESWPAGRVIGGSSSINGMIYIRGSRCDFDRWAQLGNPGWDYASVLPYFIRSETNSRGKSLLRGDDGPLHVSDVRSPHALTSVFIDAAIELGMPFNADMNGATQLGVGPLQATQKRGWRHSAARAYLWPARRRANLSVRTAAVVHRVIMEGTRAIGVEYEHRGNLVRAFARGEVILSAGALASPKLLMLSGIGPADRLSPFDIRVRADLPGVGENLQEHPGVLVTRAVNVRTYNVELDPWNVLKHASNWLFRGRGPGATPIGHAAAFANPGASSEEGEVQITFTPIGYNTTKNGSLLLPVPAVVLAVSVSHPRARGRVYLKSSGAKDLPVIEYRMFDPREDLETLREGAKLARQLFDSRAFAPYVLEELWPGPACKSNSEWEEALRHSAMRFSHPVGTCKMGIDAAAVVDPQLRVHGIEGLRVADASIMPTIPGANTNASTIMIGEKAADLLLGRAVA